MQVVIKGSGAREPGDLISFTDSHVSPASADLTTTNDRSSGWLPNIGRMYVGLFHRNLGFFAQSKTLRVSEGHEGRDPHDAQEPHEVLEPRTSLEARSLPRTIEKATALTLLSLPCTISKTSPSL